MPREKPAGVTSILMLIQPDGRPIAWRVRPHAGRAERRAGIDQWNALAVTPAEGAP